MIFSNPIIFSQVFINIGKFCTKVLVHDYEIENSFFLDAIDYQYLIRETSLEIGF